VAVVAERTSSQGTSLAINGSRRIFDPSHRVVQVGCILAVVAVAVQTVAHFANAFFFDYGVWNFDADGDGNALTWASSVATFTAALGAFLLGVMARTPEWRLVALAAVLAFFSLDDAVGLHEELTSEVVHGLDAPTSVGRVLWPLLYFPVLAFVVISLWRLAAGAHRHIRGPIVVGLALLAAAVAGETMSSLWWEEESRPLIDDVEVAIEEGAELAAWILIATAFGGMVVGRLLRVGRTTASPDRE
jgi:hypothetical protein